MEGSATTVYATGGRGNTRLLSWEGEKTLTFTVEDALLSPVSFSMLSGAGLVKGETNSNKKVHFHQTTRATIQDGYINLDGAMAKDDTICKTAPIYIMKTDASGDLTGEILNGASVVESAVTGRDELKVNRALKLKNGETATGAIFVDYYVLKKDSQASELQIDAEHFGGYFYVEADTLFRAQGEGKDYPANLTFPSVKIQSNFTFSMSATGDPSTFSFTMDAFPDYTYFDETKKVICAIQIADDNADLTQSTNTVFPHPASTEGGKIPESKDDSIIGGSSDGEIDQWQEG